MRAIFLILALLVLAGCAQQRYERPARSSSLGATEAKRHHPTGTKAGGHKPQRLPRSAHSDIHFGCMRISPDLMSCPAAATKNSTGDPSSGQPPEIPPVDHDAEKIKAIVPVYFQTNRIKLTSEANPQFLSFTGGRSKVSTFGVAEVTIPVAHKIGEVERPVSSWFTLRPERLDVSQHFTLRKTTSLSREEFVSQLANPADSLMLFVHGYNVSFENAAFSAAQISYDAGYKGRVVMFSWPSNGGLLGYDYDSVSATFSVDPLLALLKMLKEESKVSKIVVVAHSLGSDIVVKAIEKAAARGADLGISELIFAAPDVDRDIYLQRAAEIRSAAANVTVYASSVDRALAVSLIKAKSQTRMGFVLEGGPTLVEGIETIDVTAVGEDMFALNHSTHSRSRAVLDDIGRILISGEHPPHKRTPTLRLKPDESNPRYWMYPY